MSCPTDTRTWIRCPACDQDQATLWLRKQGFDIVTCRSCLVRYVNPRPAPDELAAMYRDGYFSPTLAQAAGWHHLRHDAMKQATAQLRLQLLQEFHPQGRLLDVGCGGGMFAHVAREAGWSAIGLEASPEAAAHAARERRIPIVAGRLEQLPFAGRRFDAVTMLDVLEHLFSPRTCLTEVRALLAPQGILLIETPNMAGWLPRLMGSRHPWVRPPEHLTYFTPATLRLALERAGFRVLRLLTRASKVLTPEYVLGLMESTNPLLAALGKQTVGRWRAVSERRFHVPLEVLLAVATVE